MTKVTPLILCGLLFQFGFSGTAYAEFYVWHDEHGVKHVSTHPEHCIARNDRGAAYSRCPPNSMGEEYMASYKQQAARKELENKRRNLDAQLKLIERQTEAERERKSEEFTKKWDKLHQSFRESAFGADRAFEMKVRDKKARAEREREKEGRQSKQAAEDSLKKEIENLNQQLDAEP